MKRIFLFWIVIGLFCLFLACLSTNYDYDLFARLIVGQRFIEHGIFPFKDFLSYTPTHPWYDHEWGSGVIFYLILKYIKPIGFIIFEALILWGISFFVVKTIKLQKHHYPISLTFISIFILFVYRMSTGLVRCQLFSFFFFALFLYFCEKTRIKNSNIIWWLIPITIFWNNVHGGIVAGLGLVFMYFIGSILEKKNWKKYFAVLSISTPALIINPYGIKYLNFLFSATTMNRKFIVEWWPFFAARHVIYYLPMSLYALFGFVMSFTKKIDITKTIVLLVTIAEGLWHVKLLTLAVITVTALCYNDIFRLFVRFKKPLKHIENSLYLAIILLSIFIPLSSPTVPRATLDKFPLYEIEFLKINNIKGNVVTMFAHGSYVSYKLYPDNLIYMDGRYEEVYDNNILVVLHNFELLENHWDDIITKYPTDIFIINKSIDGYTALLDNPDWELIFEGKICGVFVKKDKVKFSYFEPEYNVDYYRKTMFRGYFEPKTRKKND